MNSKLVQGLHSRTVGTLVIMILYNVLAVYGNALSPQLSVLVNVVLGAVATYFHVNPAQNYTAPVSPVS